MRGAADNSKGPAKEISSPHQSASQTASPRGSLRPAEPRRRYEVRPRGLYVLRLPLGEAVERSETDEGNVLLTCPQPA